MKIISKKKQRECIGRLIAIRRITDDMNYQSTLGICKNDVKRWADNMEYLADNILEIANIIGGIDGMKAIQIDLKKEMESKDERL